MSLLASEMKTFVELMLDLSETALREDWQGREGNDGWQEYSDNLSDVSFFVHQKLRMFSIAVQSKRSKEGPAITEAHRILAQHQIAYRDFHGAVAGVRDDELDLTPFPKKWSLRTNLVHLMVAECRSQGPQVGHALKLRRSGLAPAPMPARSSAEHFALSDYGSLSDLLSQFDEGHNHLVCSLSTVTDDELDTPSVYWEDEPVTIRFRLHRFAWHIQSHIMQADKIRIAIGHRLTDMDRFARLLYNALGDAEGSVIGAGDDYLGLEQEAAAAINLRVQELASRTNLQHTR